MSDIVWHPLGEPEGKGWPASATARRYDRLPARAEGLVPPRVWELSHDSSSLYSRFRTDATVISARWSLGSEQLARVNMIAIAASGLDLYGADAEGRVRWVGFASPTAAPTAPTDSFTNQALDGVFREYTVYLPLRNQLESVEIGVPEGSHFELVDPDPTPPVVYYGTSIIHGVAASRPGMALPAQLGRRLGRPLVGLGFDGNGKMELELAELLAEISASVYVLDCLPNMSADLVAERVEPFVRALRAKRPTTPILLVEDRSWANSWAIPERAVQHAASRAELASAYERLLAAGLDGIHYLRHDDLLGADGDAAVDGSHPSDLGFYRMADVLEPILRGLISWNPTNSPKDAS